MSAESLQEVFARVERRFERVERAFQTLLTTRKNARRDALEDVIVHGCALTIVMQNCRHLLPGFDAWYTPHANTMASDPGMKRLYKMRSEILKEGRLRVAGASIVFTEGPPWHPDPPEGAVAFIDYDEETGKWGWLVRQQDGSEAKVLTDLPDNVQVAEFLAFDPSIGTMDDLQVEMTANRYVSYLRDMVDELRVLVVRST